jgi:hypothetical protein
MQNRKLSQYLQIKNNIANHRYVNGIIGVIEDIDSIIFDLKIDDVCRINYVKRFDEVIKFINNIFSIIENNEVLVLLSEGKIFSFESFDFIETIKLFIVGAIYFSDDYYEYTKQSRDRYVTKLLEFLLKYKTLTTACTTFNQTISKLKEFKNLIERELKRNHSQIRKQKDQLLLSKNPVIINTINNAIKQLDETIQSLNELNDDLDSKISEYSNNDEIINYNIVEIIKPLFYEIYANLTEPVPMKFNHEYKNYEKKTTYIWLESSLSNHMNNNEDLLIPSSFF